MENLYQEKHIINNRKPNTLEKSFSSFGPIPKKFNENIDVCHGQILYARNTHFLQMTLHKTTTDAI